MLHLFAAALLSTSPPALPPSGLGPDALILPASAHRFELDRHRGLPPAERLPGWVDRSVRSGVSKPTREVHAYLPYWSLDYDAFHWDLLTTLAYFSAEMNASGNITDDHGWSDSATVAAVRAEAQANGVRFILTITLFDDGAIATLVNSATNRANAIENITNLVTLADGDGVNIDFEGVPSSAKAGLVTFMQDLEAALTAAGAGYVTIATPAVDWNGSFDFDQLAMACDGLMIMGYDYHWSGSSQAGPNSPVTQGTIWGKYTLTWTLDDYFKYGLAANKHKFILGLPFYGRDWPTASAAIPSNTLDTGSSVVFTKCKTRAAAAGGFKWDAHSQTSYFMETKAGVTHQIWCDDGPSMAAKMALVEEYDIGGIGIWALGYDGTLMDYWDPIGEAIGGAPPVEPDPGPVDAGGPIEADAGGPIVVDAGPSVTPDVVEPVDAGGPITPEDAGSTEPTDSAAPAGDAGSTTDSSATSDLGGEPVEAPTDDTLELPADPDAGTPGGRSDAGTASQTGVVGVQRVEGDAGCSHSGGGPRGAALGVWLAGLVAAGVFRRRR